MINVIGGLLLRTLVVLSGTAILTFALLWNAPGDPAQAIAMARFDALLTDEVIDQVREEVGLNRSFLQAFWAWLGPLMTLDLGNSAVTGRPVWPDLLASMSYTFPLAFAALAIGLALSVPLAIVAAKRPSSLLDRFAVGIASLGNAIPAYWLGLILILIFAVQLAWLPAFGASTPAHAILPALTLGLGVAASLTRIIRSGIIEAVASRLPPCGGAGVGTFGRQNHIALMPPFRSSRSLVRTCLPARRARSGRSDLWQARPRYVSCANTILSRDFAHVQLS